MTRTLVAASLALGLSACSSSDEPSRRAAVEPVSLEAVVSQPAAWASAPASASPIISLPSGGGDVAQVHERTFTNGFAQTVALQGERSAKDANRVEITVATEKAEGSGRGQAPMWKPSEAGIKAEIRGRFPGVAMQVVTRPMKNAYGPYGLAVGRQGDARCIYAWQWIDDVRASARGTPRWMTAGRAVPASLRVRLCRAGVTTDELAALVDDLTIDLNRRSEPAQTLEASLPQAPGKVRATRSRVATDAPEDRETAASTSAAAPARRSGKTESQPISARDVGTRAPAALSADGRPYLAPVQADRTVSAVEGARGGRMSPGPVGAIPSTGVPSPHGGASPRAAGTQKGKALDPSLPIQAYLGPGAQPGRTKTLAPVDGPAAPASAQTDQP